MTFTALIHWLAIDHKLKGKYYNASPENAKANPEMATTAPFDTHLVKPGSTWELPDGATFIQKRELSGVVTPQGGTPM
jgi:dUTPase